MRTDRREFEASIADVAPTNVMDLSLADLEARLEGPISQEYERMKFLVDSALQSRTRMDQKISAVSDNTRTELAFVKGVATMQLLDYYGLYEAYEQATEVYAGTGVHWRFQFAGPGGVGIFTSLYTDESIQGVATRTQKLLFCART